MVEISDVVLCSPESIRLMDNEFGFVVESFNGAVVDGHLEVVEEVVLVSSRIGARRECVAHQNHFFRYRLAQPARR